MTDTEEPTIDRVYMGEEAIKKMEEEQSKKLKLPPLPEGVLPFNEEEEKLYKFDGDMKDFLLRLKWKLYNLWVLWGNVRNNEKLIKIVNDLNDVKEGSDEIFLKTIIVSLIDSYGKILGSTPIAEEIFYQPGNPEAPEDKNHE